MAAGASGTLNMFSVYLISKLASPPAFLLHGTSAWYIDWLKARSVVALGMMTATRNFLAACDGDASGAVEAASVGVVDGWDVAGAWVAELLQATTMSDSAAAAMSDVRSFMCPFLRAGRRMSARRSRR